MVADISDEKDSYQQAFDWLASLLDVERQRVEDTVGHFKLASFLGKKNDKALGYLYGISARALIDRGLNANCPEGADLLVSVLAMLTSSSTLGANYYRYIAKHMDNSASIRDGVDLAYRAMDDYVNEKGQHGLRGFLECFIV
jgi:hypothetical protein